MPQSPKTITAAILAIGDELLTGRTKDKNIGFIADFLFAMGIDLKEARIVSDDQQAIVSALNALRSAYTYVFTTGGIGPTHDDITADAVAAAFDVSIDHHPDAVAMLKRRYDGSDKFELNEARLRMARIPDGAELIENRISHAPGFKIGNVFVMAGVPAIMQAMMEEISKSLDQGLKVHSETIETKVAEGDLAAGLGDLQKKYLDLMIGSYPFYKDNGFGTNIVIRGRDQDSLAKCKAEAISLVSTLMPG